MYCITVSPLDAQVVDTLDWYWGLYADNASAIDTTKFIRAHLQWDAVGSLWRIRGQHATGGAVTDGTWTTVRSSPISPITIRVTIRNGTTSTGRVWVTDQNWQLLGETRLYNASFTQTWGTVWARHHLSKPAGSNATMYWSGYDFI